MTTVFYPNEKRQSAAQRCVQNGVKKYIFNRQREGENYFLKRRRNHWPIDFLDLKKDVKLSKIQNKYRNTEIQKYKKISTVLNRSIL